MIIYRNHWDDTSAGGLLVPRGNHPYSSQRFGSRMVYQIYLCNWKFTVPK